MPLAALDAYTTPKDIDDGDVSEDAPSPGLDYECEQGCGETSGGTPTGARGGDLDPAKFGFSDGNSPIPEPGRTLTGFDIFANESFRTLGVKRVRLIVPWNVAEFPPGNFDLEKARTWINNATSTDNPGGPKRVMISFERCRERHPDAPADLTNCAKDRPTRSDYRSAVDKFIALFGDKVEDYTPWNEPNNRTYQPTDDVIDTSVPGAPGANPENSGAFAAGEYYLELADACEQQIPRCSVAAGDFLDSQMTNPKSSNAGSYGRLYFEQYTKGMRSRSGGRTTYPAAWAFHLYSDGQETSKLEEGKGPKFTRLRNFLGATKSDKSTTRSPDVWLTEQGARRLQVVFEKNPDGSIKTDSTGVPIEKERKKNSYSCQARIVRYLTRAPLVDNRISRFYLYQLRGDEKFDFGLLNARNKQRPAYSVYRGRTDRTFDDTTRTRCP